jgi:two-component system chemotaxis response regulator CheB
MPRSAIARVKVDHVLPSEQIGAVITELTMIRATGLHSRPKAKLTPGKAGPRESTPERPGVDALRMGALDTPPSPFTCPDCGGTLWEMKAGKLVRYRCHVGHGFSGESLAAAQENKLEETLWSALRAIEESIALRRRLLERGRAGTLAAVAPGVTRDIGDLEQRATALRELLLSGPGSVGRHVGVGKKRRRVRRANHSRA